ncbi:Uncharacterised protein [Citrobacter amalonaticus]|nr:Uncharacterised protein [Citrobacter amalonaticus]
MSVSAKDAQMFVLLRTIFRRAGLAVDLHQIMNIRTFPTHGQRYYPLTLSTGDLFWINPCHRVGLTHMFLIVAPTRNAILLIIALNARRNTPRYPDLHS